MAGRYQYGTLMIRKRQKGPDVWQFRWTEQGRRKSVLVGTTEKLPTRADAERAVEHLRVRINAAVPQAQFHRVTVGTVIDRFVAEELGRDRRYLTQAVYRSYFERYIRPRWAATLLSEVKVIAVRDWLATLKLAPVTKGHIRALLHLLFQWAGQCELTDRNPVEFIRLKNTRRLRDPRVLTPAEFRALVAELKEPYRTMALLAGYTGLRASEIVGLQWGDVDWDHLVVFVRRSVVAGLVEATKNAASQKPVPLDPVLATALLKWRGVARYVASSDFVFAGDSGKPNWQGWIQKDHLRPAALRAGITGPVGWHTFRHSYRAWLKRGAEPVEVQKDLMRHARLETTMEYGVESEVSPLQRAANSRVVRLLRG